MTEINLNSKGINKKLAEEARKGIEENMERLIARIEGLERMLEEKENGSKISRVFTPGEFLEFVGENHETDLRAEILTSSGGADVEEVNHYCFHKEEIEKELGVTPQKLVEVLEGMMDWTIEADDIDGFKTRGYVIESYAIDKEEDVVVIFGSLATKTTNAMFQSVTDAVKSGKIDIEDLINHFAEALGGK